MIVRAADPRRDGAAILAIVNDAIVNTTAWYDYEPWDAERLTSWFDAKRAGGWPVIVADAGDGALGFASFGMFRDRPAYAHTVEHSVYVSAEKRGQGIGGRLLDAIVEAGRARQAHVMIGGIDAANAGSLAFHRAAGFEEAGRLREVGWKFGRWLDLVFMQKRL